MNIERIEEITKQIKIVEKRKARKEEKFKNEMEDFQLEIECLHDELAKTLAPIQE